MKRLRKPYDVRGKCEIRHAHSPRTVHPYRRAIFNKVLAMSTTTPRETKMRQLRIAPFALALICFLLPFVEVSCQGRKMVTLTGLQLATGTQIQQRDAFSGQAQTREIPREPLVFFVLLCTVVATGYCFVSGSRGRKVSALAGTLALILLFVAKSKMDNDAVREGQGMLIVGYGIGYIFTCVLLVVGVAISGWQMSLAGAAPTASPPLPPPTP